MKKLYGLLAVFVLVLTACGGGKTPEPTAIPSVVSVPTAFPSPTTAPANPTAEPPSGGPPDAGEEKVSSADGMVQVYIPEGTFKRGGLDAVAETDEMPATDVTLHGFWMDKTEVTNAMYLLCFQNGGCKQLPHLGNQSVFKSETRKEYFKNPEFNDYPVVYVGWGDAKAYCEWAGRRLPSEAEWEYAARGGLPSLNTFPWGDQKPDNSYANFNYYLGDTAPVGSFPAGASPFGILDMAGNVAEWVNDFYDPNYYGSGVSLNPTGPLARGNFFERVVRGGHWGDAWQQLRVSKRSSVMGPNPNQPPDTDRFYGMSAPTIGFRCVSDN
ncbi:MAG: SUMF1/EgtB/PvdO family nonheme iron enzyme [Chloroflexota bacterium]